MLDSATMSIRIDGMPARTETIYRHVAYLPQESFLPRELKVEACIRLFLQSESQRYFVSDDKRVKELSASRIGRLSGGERRYIELLLILARDQDFLLLDEPFAELDPIYRERAVGLIKDASLKKGIILTDQDYRSVLSASTSLALLSNCNLKHIGSGIELIQYGYISGQ
jgi:ABC-type multidrug transport system ATPase subunit